MLWRGSKSGCGNWYIQFLFVFLFVCTSRFANFARREWYHHDSKKCSEIRTVTCLVIWLWKLKISIFVCLFVYLFVCTSRFANFANGKWSNHDSKNCSEIRTVTWLVIWLWKLKISIFVCLFVYFFVCTSRFANFARGKWFNHDFKNCSEIRAVTPFWIWLWNFQIETSSFFTTL